MSVKGRSESVSHMDVVNADVAGANICPWKLDDSILAVNTYAKHPAAKFPIAKIPSVMGVVQQQVLLFQHITLIFEKRSVMKIFL